MTNAEQQQEALSRALDNYPVEEEPTLEQLSEWMDEGGCETPDGCWVEADGTCEHGQDSWMLIMGLI